MTSWGKKQNAGSGKEEGAVAEWTVETGKHVSKDSGVRMTDMRTVIHIIDRSGDIKFFAHDKCSLSAASGDRHTGKTVILLNKLNIMYLKNEFFSS